MSLKDSYEANYATQIKELDGRIAGLTSDRLKMSSGDRQVAGDVVDELLQKRRDLRSRLFEIRNSSESDWSKRLSSQQVDFE